MKRDAEPANVSVELDCVDRHEPLELGLNGVPDACSQRVPRLLGGGGNGVVVDLDSITVEREAKVACCCCAEDRLRLVNLGRVGEGGW